MFNCSSGECISLPSASSDCSSGAACVNRFAFWYEDWVPGNTLSALAGAQLIIGTATSTVPAIHAANARALAYETYYQSSVPGTFISSTSDISSVAFQGNDGWLTSVLDPGWLVLCANSVNLHQRVLAQLNTLLGNGYDGVFVDNTISPPASGAVCSAPHAHVNPDQRGDDAYLALLAEVRSAFSQRVPSGLLITNPGSPMWADQLGTGPPTLWDLSDFVLWESYGYTSYTDQRHDDLQNTIQYSRTYAADPVKASKLIALSYPQSSREALLSFAIARMFGFRWTANLGVDGSAGHFGEFTSSMPFSVGEPEGVLYVGNGLLARGFSNGIAYANISASALTVTVPQAGNLVMDTGATTIAANFSLTLPSHAAAVVLTQ